MTQPSSRPPLAHRPFPSLAAAWHLVAVLALLALGTGCDGFGDPASTRIDAVITADVGVYFFGEVEAIGTTGRGTVSVAELFGRNDNEHSPLEPLVIRTGYNERMEANGLVGWRLYGVRVPSFTKISEGPGVVRVELYEDGVFVDAVEAREYGEGTRSMRAGSLPSGFD